MNMKKNILIITFILFTFTCVFSNDLQYLYNQYSNNPYNHNVKTVFSNELLNRARTALNTKNYNYAYNYLQEALKLNINNSKVYKILGLLYEATGYYSYAGEYLLKYVESRKELDATTDKILDKIVDFSNKKDNPIVKFNNIKLFLKSNIPPQISTNTNNYTPPVRYNTESGYISSFPLGEKLSLVELGEGPFGAVAVPAPGTSGRFNHSIGIGIIYIADDLDILQVPFFYSFGISNYIDLSLGIPYMNIEHGENGGGDLFFGIKGAFKTYTPKIGINLGFNFPTGDDDIFGEDNGTDISLDVPIQFDFGNWILNTNVGFTSADISKDAEVNTLKSGISFSKTLSGKLSGSLDFLFDDLTDEIETTSFGFIGLKWAISNKVSSNFSIGTQFNKNGIDAIISSSLGISF